MNESQFQKLVIETAHLYGWKVAHFKAAPTPGLRGWATPVQADGKGFPDLVMVKGSRLLFVELKAEKGKLRPEQEMWLNMLTAAGQEYHVWRPSYFANIEALLASSDT